MAGGQTTESVPANEALLIEHTARKIRRRYRHRAYWIHTDALTRGRRGLSDWFLILDGQAYVWEFKHPLSRARIRPRQERELAEAARAGARTAIITSVQQALTILEEHHPWQPTPPQ